MNNHEPSSATPPQDQPELPLRQSQINLPWLAIGLLTVVMFLLRSLRLTDLPIFGDEAIYLRWAQLIGRDFHLVIQQYDWYRLYAVPLIDPKPPVHFWLMAVTDGHFADPLAGARMISVVAGVLLIPVMVLVVRRLRHLLPQDHWQGLSSYALLMALMIICCPFLAFYQRLATADALFILEMALCVWLALRLTGDALNVPLGRGLLTHALPFGVAIGIAMNTRQILSYELWVLPVAIWALTDQRKKRAAKVSLWLIAAIAVGIAMFMPYLLAEPGRYAPENPQDVIPGVDMFKYELRRRVLYQPHFSEAKTLHDRWLMFSSNFRDVFIPNYSKSGETASGWLWFYLTPPVCLLAVIGVIMMAAKKHWRLLMFIAFWAAMFLAPLILFGAVTFSRYALAGVLPILLLSVWVIARGSYWSFAKLPPAGAWCINIILMLVTFGWPVYDVNKQIQHWPTQRLVAEDRWQYITGWPGGFAARNAIAYLKSEMKKGPVIIITNNEWGTPADAVWAYCDGVPGATVYYVDWAQRKAILTQEELVAGRGKLMAKKWRYLPEEEVDLPAGVPIFYVSGSPLGGKVAPEAVAPMNHFVEDPLEFKNPLRPDGSPAENSVFVFKLR